MTPGAGCSITSTATVSTAGATGCFTFRVAFFTGAGLGLALATVRFAVLATLRDLPRLAEFPLRSFARFCTFDPFLRFAMIAPLHWCSRNDTTLPLAKSYQTRSYQQTSVSGGASQALCDVRLREAGAVPAAVTRITASQRITCSAVTAPS